MLLVAGNIGGGDHENTMVITCHSLKVFMEKQYRIVYIDEGIHENSWKVQLNHL